MRSTTRNLILTVELKYEHDVVLARRRSRQMAALLGFDLQEQTRIATAVSEIARNAYQYAGGGKVQFAIETGEEQILEITIRDSGKGIPNLPEILDGLYRSRTGMGLGIIGAQRLVDSFSIDSKPGGGTTVVLGKAIPRNRGAITREEIARITGELSAKVSEDPFDEVQQQNQELMRTMEELRRRQAELAQLNRELEDTNRGVVALYAELDERADYLRRASELKSRFLSNMTHEFRTPLNSILSLSRLLLDRVDGDLSDEQEKQVKYMRQSANDLSELVNDLLDLAKVEAGKVIIRPQQFQVGDLFGALRGMLRPLLASNSSVSLVFDDPIGIPPMSTDEGKVSQILRNFISNALKFTEEGEVRVSAGLDTDGASVTFAVKDTGCGIAPEDQERIFQEFTQVDNPQQRKVRGTGLGLPLSRKLTELLGGDLWLTSEVGKGSTFYARIPIEYRGPAEASVAPEIREDLDPTRVPVLVVEDNKETLFIYDKYLKGTGYQPIPARTLSEARKLLKRLRPVAVVLDILLEGESSWTLLSELKGSEATADLPVFVCTVVDNQMKARALGADAFCTKPVDRNWLLQHLKSATAPGRHEKILIIDDDEISRYLLSGLLMDTRFAVLEANNGDDGLRMAEERPRAIFLDLTMPGMDGFQVLESLKKRERTRDIPVIIYSSKRLTAHDEQRLASQVVAVLPKESPSREVALQRIREALISAGVSSGVQEEQTHA